MKKLLVIGILGIFYLGFLNMSFTNGQKTILNYESTGYLHKVYNEIPLGQIHPEGWLKDQLETMKKNSTGHLDEIYDKIKINNGWLGGEGDGWEETPYWLDGALPLAFQLNDDDLKKKVLKYINWSLNNQRPSGYFGPITKWERETGKKIDTAHCNYGEDWWPKMVMLKVIKQYYSATRDKRVIPFLTKYFEYQSATLNKCPLGKWSEWAEARGGENIEIVQWLYEQTGNKKLLLLAEKLRKQTFSWSDWFGNRDWAINAAVNPNGENWMHRHGVNVGMALKLPAENFERTGDSTYLKELKTGFHDLMTLHGLPNGIYSADEDLHGNDPTQGTELCAIVETMYSLEEVIAITGDPYYMDALERTTFNAMPPQTTDDFNEKQYFQIANQIEINRGVYDFTLPFSRRMNNVLGAKSGYTCCYANMHQGWTKFTQHLWYKTHDNGLAALEYSPNIIHTNLGKDNEEIEVEEVTTYPFDDLINFKISTKNKINFSFQFRIPNWCKTPSITVNGELVKIESNKRIITLKREWKNKDVITLKLPMKVRTSSWAENSKTIERGPLVYGLKIREIWDKGNDEREGDYYTVKADSKWNFGLLKKIIDSPENNSEVNIKGLKQDFKWNLENIPIEIDLKAKEIFDWKAVNGMAPLPVSGRTGFYQGNIAEDTQTITLVPIGFTKLRIVAFPVVK